MYSTTDSIMLPNIRFNSHSTYPFLNEIISGDLLVWDEEYAMYPDEDEDSDEDSGECLCCDCKKRLSERYEPPITRLQVENQQKLININEKILESYTKLSYYNFEYMEEQKDYNQSEVEKKLDEKDSYITEEEYRKNCDKIKDRYEEVKDSRKLYNDIDFTQFMMRDYKFCGFDKYMENCKEEYEDNMDKIFILQINISMLKA